MPKEKPKRKLTKAEKRKAKVRQIREADLVRHRTEAFLSQFSPEVRAHLKGELFKKLDERRQQRQHE